MKAKDALAAMASGCAVIGFVAGTASSTIYAGLVYAGALFGSFLFFALVDSAYDAHNGKTVTMEALKGMSVGELTLGSIVVLAVFAAMVLDGSERGAAWNQSFGLAQLAAVVLSIGAGVVIWQEWEWEQSRRQKKCPDCARKILADARKCEHCGYRFDMP